MNLYSEVQEPIYKSSGEPLKWLAGGGRAVTVDEMNQRILRLLKMDGKMTYREVAEKLRRSPSTVRDRIKRMEDFNVILGYSAIVNNELMGMQSDAIVLANIGDGVTVKDLRKLRNVDGVMEVLLVSGGRGVLIRLHAPDNHTLESTIANSIIPLGLKDVEVRIILESVMRFPGI